MSDQFQTLEEWLDEWQAAVEAGQSAISRAEAINRYYKWCNQNEDCYWDQEEMEIERDVHSRIKEARE